MGLEFDGGAYHGWERQRGPPTVQARVEDALSRVANDGVATISAGRTDAGVHALGQVVHFDAPVLREPHAWVMGTNANLPPDVAVLWAAPVPDSFHARFSAVRRHYRYIIFNRPVRTALLRGRASWCYRVLDVSRMQAAADLLVGEHDFTSYRAAGCQARSPIRTVHHLAVSRQGRNVVIDVCANAFLQHMVRNVAGVLIAVGAGERPPGWAGEVLQARDRRRGGVTADPNGLYLVAVDYPARFRLPAVPPSGTLW